MLRIDIQSVNTVASLVCSGRLVFGVEIETLRTMVQSRREENIRIDLSAVDKIDASGLGLLVELHVWAREEQRKITLVNLSENVWRLVILTRLYAALELSDSDMPQVSRDRNDFEANEMIA